MIFFFLIFFSTTTTPAKNPSRTVSLYFAEREAKPAVVFSAGRHCCSSGALVVQSHTLRAGPRHPDVTPRDAAETDPRGSYRSGQQDERFISGPQ